MKKNSGFTLVETVVVIAIIGVIAGIAIPAFLSWLPNMRFREASRDALQNMQLAKMEAIKRNVRVVVLLNSVACPPPGADVPVPGGGYTIFVDDGAGIGGVADDNTQNGDEVPLKAVTMPRNVALCAETFGGTTGFLSSSLPTGGAGTFGISNDNGRTATVTISLTGNVSL